ncbi:MAG TPA: hypothetical protein VLO30_08400 [Chthoniobacterales bacterium]|nr:hypothetical protein [Chthoniobacterales bacterium]
MRKLVVIVLTTFLSLAIVAISIAIEPDRTNDMSRLQKDNSAATATAVAADPKAIAKLIDDVNAAVRTDKQRMLSIITINTDVAVTTLEQEKARTGLSFGEVYVAHSLALASKKKFSTIVALKKSGQSWAQIAKSHNVTLKGSRELIKEMQKQ